MYFVIQELIISANVGGVFGIFLGYSTLSVFEIFFYLYKGIRNH